jgi:hypothetical protein
MSPPGFAPSVRSRKHVQPEHTGIQPKAAYASAAWALRSNAPDMQMSNQQARPLQEIKSAAEPPPLVLPSAGACALLYETRVARVGRRAALVCTQERTGGRATAVPVRDSVCLSVNAFQAATGGKRSADPRTRGTALVVALPARRDTVRSRKRLRHGWLDFAHGRHQRASCRRVLWTRGQPDFSDCYG